MTHVLAKERAFVDGPRAIFKMNHENGGFDRSASACVAAATPPETSSAGSAFRPQPSVPSS
ncbi:hypothetical protein ACFWFQ_29300, partial [Nocardia salmonicida]|uniref:hypothetical protein n=1 Tax=Nocardia salmonicida TaxID=53431 RepID=UPI00365C871C